MNFDLQRPKFKKKIKINGPVLFLVGPIGTFFARLSRYLENKNIRTYKISFPLFEYGFPKENRIYFDQDVIYFKEFLNNILIEKQIKHIFMYGNVLLPHQDALKLVKKLNKEGNNIKSHIFELGYFRPNFVTLEESGINYDSQFLLGKDFYSKQKYFQHFPIVKKHGIRIRKIWKAITFVRHSFTKYKIVDFDHKLQPKPSYIWFQIKGFILKYFFYLMQYNIKRICFSKKKFYIVILQVSRDSQLLKGSKVKDNFEFINLVITSFYNSELKNTKLIFKHHPRDRGYNNYSNHIRKLSKKFGLEEEIFYIHDYPLSKIFKNHNCKGTVLVNSTVGYQSLFHSVPVKSFGISPYNFEGLTDQRDLVDFFRNPKIVDIKLFNKFYCYVLENSQINGNFDGFFPFTDIFE